MPETNGGTPRRQYRAYVLALSGVTAALAVAAPTMAMPVLFSEVAEDLRLSLVQVGLIWGIASFAGLFASLAGGMIGDRYGARRTLTVACLLLGVTGASRALANSAATMTATVFLNGLVAAVVPITLHKVCAMWFRGRGLGSANAVVSGGMALGFMIGSLISASVLSPWLGSWRHVLLLYGGVAVLLGFPWALSRIAPWSEDRPADAGGRQAIRHAFSHVLRLRNVWVLGIALLCVWGGVQGLLGYLPLYLREVGWATAQADACLASFHAVSLLAVFPLALLSDRMRSRRGLLVGAALMIAGGVGLLSIVDGFAIWIAVLMAGAVRDGFMAVFMTAVTEEDGVGAEYAGTALGLAMTLGRMGALVGPPLGNGLAAYGPRVPFLLWGAMALLGLTTLQFLRRDRA
ncbi:MAG: MFS transporter [Candidatus Bipolaricaulota bacterium]|nr:MAG: MFS transporter [Candidatus Bipolaricaulota bacterium]